MNVNWSDSYENERENREEEEKERDFVSRENEKG